MREKKDYNTSEKRSRATDRNNSTRKTSDDSKSFKKDFGRSEGNSYFDRKEEKRPSRSDERRPSSRFNDRDEKKTYSPRSSDSRDERKTYSPRSDERRPSRYGEDRPSSRFNDRDEKKTYSPRSSDSRDERKTYSSRNDERRPSSRFNDRDEKKTYSPRSGDSRDERKTYSPRSSDSRDERKTYSSRNDERRPSSRFNDRDEKKTYSPRSGDSRDERKTYSSRNDERRPSSRFNDRDEKKTYSPRSGDSRDERRPSKYGEDRPSSKFNDREDKRNRRDEASKYLNESESKVRKPRTSEIKDLGYEEQISAKLIENNSIEDETRNTYIYGRHPVVEALKGQTPVNKVWIADGTRDTDQIVEHIIEKNIPYKIVTKTKLSYLVGENTNHQGVVAEVAGKEYTEFHELIELTKQKEVFFIVLDKVEDPHNLGAIIRTADAAGVDAIIVPKHRAVGLTGIVTKSSAGAIDRMKICRVPNLVQAIEELKKANVWIVGIDMEGTENYPNAKLTGAIALTVGGEGEGLTRLVKEHCDFIVKIPMNSASNSLNVSVATAIVTFEIYKQREFK
jgi:23S rRNA (guanosine2251-2'-O)-methyltransferase